jgi:hypothetical protein
MKLCRLFLASVAFGGLAANTGYAQYRSPTPNAVAKHPHFNPPASPAYPHGSIGGPTSKAAGIGGLAGKTGGVNGTVKPKH